MLTDQHLLAENKEINQLAGQMQRSFGSPNFDFNALPDTYTLGKGHVRSLYVRGEFVRRRYRLVYEECLNRNFKVSYNFNDVWKDLGERYNRDLEPTDAQMELSVSRIREKIVGKPGFYRYYGRPIDQRAYLWALTVMNADFIKR